MNKNQLTQFTPEDDTFKADGITYSIYTDKMCFDRVVAFQKLATKIVTGKGSADYHNFLKTVYQALRQDASANAANGDAQRILFNYFKAVEGRSITIIHETMHEDILDLCCLFVYTKDEDMTKIDEDHFDRKKEAWKKHCDYNSFFLLGLQHLSTLPTRLRQNSPKVSATKSEQSKSEKVSESKS